MPQLLHLRSPSASDLYLGAKLLLWGYFAKAVLGDGIARVVDETWADWAELSWLSLVLVHMLFSFQIFFDFVGYTSIARGLGRLMGIDLVENFLSPYAARSIRGFWRRWHVSLTSWFRDYLYVPLGGNRRGWMWWTAAVAAVFLLSGLWHGAAVGFVLWGALHAGFYIFGRWSQPLRDRGRRFTGLDRAPLLEAVIQTAIVFSLVSIAWLPFRVQDLSILSASIATLGTLSVPDGSVLLAPTLLQTDALVFALLCTLFVILDGAGWIRQFVTQGPTSGRMIVGELATVNVMVVLLIFLGDLGSREFLYFRF